MRKKSKELKKQTVMYRELIYRGSYYLTFVTSNIFRESALHLRASFKSTYKAEIVELSRQQERKAHLLLQNE